MSDRITPDSQQPLTQDALSQIPKKISLHSQLPNFKDVPANQKTILFISKLRQCNKLVRIDDQDLRKLKHLVLYQLLEMVNAQNNIFPIDAVQDFFNTVSLNIFRQAPKPQAEDEDVYDPEEDEPQVDANWYHLQFVYEMLLRFVYSAQTQNPDYQKAVKKYIDCDFIVRMMQLFNQSDPRERDYVKTILHRIYANIMSLRAFIRQTLKSELQTYFCTGQQHSGICDILEVLGSIINGYATPLKTEHTQFLTQCLVPMHKVQYIKHILPQLSYCVSKFIEKEPSLSGYILHQILSYYPRLNSHKEVSILTEIEELLELMPGEYILCKQGDKFSELGIKTDNPLFIYTKLFEVVAQAMCSLHFQVAERAVNMVGNQKFLQHISVAYTKYCEITAKKPAQAIIYEDDEMIPTKPPQEDYSSLRMNPIHILSKALRANYSHWNSNIKFLSDQSFKQLQQLNQKETGNIDQKVLYEEVTKEYIRQAHETMYAIYAEKALANVGKFGDYFAKKTPYLQSVHVPGYQIETISTEAVVEAVVPEDPLFCRVPEMSLKQLQLTPEIMLATIEESLKQCTQVGKMQSQMVQLKGDLSQMDQLAIKGVDILNKQFAKQIIEQSIESLIKNDLVKTGEIEQPVGKLFTVTTKMPGKRMANRRASAGVQLNMGVRRKSVVPMNSTQKNAQKELEGFEKHNIK